MDGLTKRTALIFANGDGNDGPMVQCALQQAVSPLVVAADGGAQLAQRFGFRLNVVVGDMDSLPPDTLQTLTAAGVEVVRHPPEKDFTDLELALHYVAEQGADWIRVIGGVGDRLDQTLANVYLLALPVLRQRDARLVAGKQEVRLLYPGQHDVHGAAGDTVSLIPLGGAAHGIETSGLYYPLREESLDFGPARGISNVMTAEAATITLRDGVLLLVHTIGRA